jgi:hypothetical protein
MNIKFFLVVKIVTKFRILAAPSRSSPSQYFKKNATLDSNCKIYSWKTLSHELTKNGDLCLGSRAATAALRGLESMRTSIFQRYVLTLPDLFIPDIS